MIRKRGWALSLRIFHIVFIVASIILTFGFGLWASLRAMNLTAGVSFSVGILLVVYLVKVIKKLKKLDVP